MADIKYSLVDVSVNNGINGQPTWIVIRDIVYDVTTYLDDVRTVSYGFKKKNNNLSEKSE